MNTIAIVQARLASERLPGKVLEEIGGVAAVRHVALRALRYFHTVVACPADDLKALQEVLPPKDGVGIFGWPGEAGDVLSRFAELIGVTTHTCITIVRLTADCPFVDVDGIKAVANLVESGAADYATTNPGAKQLRIDGYDAEAFTRELLLAAHDNAITAYDREHVTPWIRREAKSPWHVHRDAPMAAVPWHVCTALYPHRWTLDTQEDLYWFREVADEIDVTPPLHPTYEELMALLERRPDLVRTGQ